MSISLNGNTSNYLSITSALGIADVTSDQTWAAWVKPANSNANKMVYAALRGDGYSTDLGMRFNDSAAVIPYWTGTEGASIGSYSADTWYYIFQKRNVGSNFSPVAGYAVSGCGFDADGDFTTKSSAASATGIWTSINIGRKGADGYPWNGEICCFRVWDAELTLAELRAEAVSATPVKTANLRSNWRLATNSDLTSTVNSYALTANGTVSTGSTEPTDIAGASAVAKMASYYRMLRSA